MGQGGVWGTCAGAISTPRNGAGSITPPTCSGRPPSTSTTRRALAAGTARPHPSAQGRIRRGPCDGGLPPAHAADPSGRTPANRKFRKSPARSRGWRRKWIFRSWRFRSSTVNWKSARTTSAAVRPPRVGRHRTGRRRHHVHLPREVYHKQPDNPHKGSAEIIIGKQRNGPIGTATLAYLAPTPHLRISNPDCRPSLPKRAANNLPEVRHETTRSHSANVHARSGSRRGTVVRAFLA